MAMLEVREISKSFGGVAALSSASFILAPGEVHALMGENGAGKSTLGRICAGAAIADGGVMFIDGERVELTGPLDAQRRGIAIIHQELDLFPNLTVGENIVIGNLNFAEGIGVSGACIASFCRPFLAEVGLGIDPATPVGQLPIGQQQLVAIARALSMTCRILIMDESTSALAEDAVERLFAVIAKLKARGVAIIYVSHKMDEIFALCDTVTVLRDGATIATRPIAETDRAELIRMMVGREVDLTERRERGEPGEVLIAATGVTSAKLRGVSFEVRRGEVLGIAGLVGAGRSEVGAALVGLDRLVAGSMTLRGEPYAPRGPAAALAASVVLLPEDRKQQGLMLQMSVEENASLAVLPGLARAGFIDATRERAMVGPVTARLALKAASPDIAVGTLSGGNQQKALLARWLLADPDVIFLDDPARGVDVGAKEDIYAIIDELAASGKAVLLASSELPELLLCADRIMVLSAGSVVGIFAADETSQEEIMAAATHLEPRAA